MCRIGSRNDEVEGYRTGKRAIREVEVMVLEEGVGRRNVSERK